MSEDAVSEEAVSEGLDWLKGETVLVAGGRISGLAAVVPLRELGAEVVVTAAYRRWSDRPRARSVRRECARMSSSPTKRCSTGSHWW